MEDPLPTDDDEESHDLLHFPTIRLSRYERDSLKDGSNRSEHIKAWIQAVRQAHVILPAEVAEECRWGTLLVMLSR